MEIEWFPKEFQLTLNWHTRFSVPESNKKNPQKEKSRKDHTFFIGKIQSTTLLLLISHCLYRKLRLISKELKRYFMRGDFYFKGIYTWCKKHMPFLVSQDSIEEGQIIYHYNHNNC